MKLIKSIFFCLTLFLINITLVNAETPGVGYPIMFTGRINTSVDSASNCYFCQIYFHVSNGFGSGSRPVDENHSFYFMLLPNTEVKAEINLAVAPLGSYLCEMEVSSKNSVISINVKPHKYAHGITCTASGDPNQGTFTIAIDEDEKKMDFRGK